MSRGDRRPYEPNAGRAGAIERPLQPLFTGLGKSRGISAAAIEGRKLSATAGGGPKRSPKVRKRRKEVRASRRRNRAR
jgi:hypothetical protein